MPLSELPSTSASGDPAFDQLVESVCAKLQRGESIDWQAIESTHPECFERLRSLLPSLGLLARTPSEPPSTKNQPASLDMHVVAQFLHNPPSDFEILREIGRGGMGIVFEAKQRSLGRLVALKILPCAGNLNPQKLQRFKNESRAAATLQHPHIVSVYSIGNEAGIYYYSMQLLAGRTLAAVVANSDSQPLTIKSAVLIAIQAAQALHYAHEQGIIHRDIKPSNLMLDDRNHLWITDFGLAQIEDETQLTRDGEFLGTLRYMCPEQFQTPSRSLDDEQTQNSGLIPSNGRSIDHRVDIYALGATLYEMLALQPVFTETNRPALLNQVLNQQPLSIRKLNPSLPAELDWIVLKALEKDAVDRYQTAADFAADLQRFLDNRVVLARRPTAFQRWVKWCRRNTVLTAAAMIALLIVACITSLSSVVVWQFNRETKAALAVSEASTKQANFQSARLAFQRGLQLCEQSEVQQGLTWFANALSQCPDDEPDFHRTLRKNIHAWTSHLHELLLALPHKNSVAQAAFGHDGQRLITSTHLGEVFVWNANDGSLQRQLDIQSKLRGPTPWALHPKQDLIAIGSREGQLHLLDLQTGEATQPTRTLPNGRQPPSPFTAVSFSPDGEFLFACDSRGAGTIWSIADERKDCVSLQVPERVLAALFDDDNSQLVTAGYAGYARAWEVSSGKLLRELFPIDVRGVLEMARLADGQSLVTGSVGFGAATWKSGEKQLTHLRYPHLARVNAVASFPQRALVATASEDWTARIWHEASAQRHGAILQHDTPVVDVQFDPAGQRLVTCAGKVVRIWKLAPTSLSKPGPDKPRSIYQLSSGDVLVVGEDWKLLRWTEAAAMPVATLESPIEGFKVSSDESLLVWGSGVEIGAIDLKSDRVLWQQPYQYPRFALAPSQSCIVFINGGNLHIAEPHTGKTLHTAPCKLDVLAFAFNEQLGRFAMGDFQGNVEIRRMLDGQLLQNLTPLGVPIDSIACSQDGARFYVATANGSLQHFDWEGNSIAPIIKLPAKFRQMIFIPGTDLAFAMAGDGSARFFDTTTGQPVGKSLTHFGHPLQVHFNHRDLQILRTRGPQDEINSWPIPQDLTDSPATIEQQIINITGMTHAELGSTIAN